MDATPGNFLRRRLSHQTARACEYVNERIDNKPACESPPPLLPALRRPPSAPPSSRAQQKLTKPLTHAFAGGDSSRSSSPSRGMSPCRAELANRASSRSRATSPCPGDSLMGDMRNSRASQSFTGAGHSSILDSSSARATSPINVRSLAVCRASASQPELGCHENHCSRSVPLSRMHPHALDSMPVAGSHDSLLMLAGITDDGSEQPVAGSSPPADGQTAKKAQTIQALRYNTRPRQRSEKMRLAADPLTHIPSLSSSLAKLSQGTGQRWRRSW